MAKLSKAIARDRKINKRKYGQTEDGRSVKYIRDIQKQRSENIRKEREHKEKILNED
jgi:hypothetical protein